MLVKLVVRTPRKLAELVSSVLFEAGAGGVEEQDNGRRLIAYAADLEGADALAARARALLAEAAPGPNGIALSVEVDESSDWATAWTKHLGQIALTPSLVIQPLWDETEAPEGARRILYDPKLSFGDGAHATTRLAARALEQRCREHLGMNLLDFGSGTGVLSFVALLCGATAAWGVDIEPVSIEAAQENARLNGLEQRVWFGLPDALVERRFELVVANLEAPTLLACAATLARHAARAERLILTGFLADRQSELLTAFGPGFRLANAAREDDWALVELVPEHRVPR